MVSKARNAVPACTIAGRLGGSEGVHSQASPGAPKARSSRPAMAWSPWRRWRVSGPPRLVSGAPAYPGAELWARPSRCGPRPARSAPSTVSWRGSASHATKVEWADRVRARRLGKSTVDHGVSTGSQQRYPEHRELRARSKSRKSCPYLQKLDQLLGSNPSQTTRSALETFGRCFSTTSKGGPFGERSF